MNTIDSSKDSRGFRNSLIMAAAIIAVAMVGLSCLLFIGSDDSEAAVVDSGTCGASVNWTLDDAGTPVISRRH